MILIQRLSFHLFIKFSKKKKKKIGQYIISIVICKYYVINYFQKLNYRGILVINRIFLFVLELCMHLFELYVYRYVYTDNEQTSYALAHSLTSNTPPTVCYKQSIFLHCRKIFCIKMALRNLIKHVVTTTNAFIQN